VAYPAHARYEDHPHRGNLGKELRVVTRAAWKMHGSKAQRCRGGFDLLLNFWRGDRGRIVNDLLDGDLGPRFPRNL